MSSPAHEQPRVSFIIVSAFKSQRNTFSCYAFIFLQPFPRRVGGSSCVLDTELNISQKDIEQGRAFHQGSSKITHFDLEKHGVAGVFAATTSQ